MPDWDRPIIGIIGGTGNLGYGLALRLAASGRQVLVGSRDVAKASAAVEQASKTLAAAGVTGARIEGLDNAEAARRADVVVIAVPSAAQAATVAAVAPQVQEKIVIDTTVSLSLGDPTSLTPPAAGSAAETAAGLLGHGVKLAAGFHTVSGKRLGELDKAIEGDVLICGDDAEAKAAAAALAEALGARPIDAGPLRQAQTLERLTALIIGLNRRYRRRHVGLRFTGL